MDVPDRDPAARMSRHSRRNDSFLRAEPRRVRRRHHLRRAARLRAAGAANRATRRGTMTIHVDVALRLGKFRLEAKFESSGHLTALFGRSGAGKTSLINVIAGLLRPELGYVAVNGDVL